MNRLRAAMREWFELRTRVRREREFHFERTLADLAALGVEGAEAKREARRRLASGKTRAVAMREIGGDLAGLTRVLRANRVFRSPWIQPVALTTAIALLLGFPAARAAIHDAVSGPGPVHGRVLFQAASGAFPRSISDTDFATLQAMSSVTGVERYRNVFASAQAVGDATAEQIRTEASALVGHELRVKELDSPRSTPFAVWLWLFGVPAALYWARRQLGACGVFGRAYAACVVSLHASVSILAWINLSSVFEPVTAQPTWLRFAYGLGGVVFFAVGVLQVALWRRDLLRRCPACLDRMVMPLTEGDPSSLVLNPETTELVCPQGHGAMAVDWQARRFKRDDSSFFAQLAGRP